MNRCSLWKSIFNFLEQNIINLLQEINLYIAEKSEILHTSPYLIWTSKKRFSRVHFHQYTSQGPHVYGQVIGNSQEYFWWTIKPALDVLVDLEKNITSISLIIIHLFSNKTLFFSFSLYLLFSKWWNANTLKL